RYANRAGVDCWLVPMATSDHAMLLNAPLVVVVPDLAYVEFPPLFSSVWMEDTDARVRRVVSRAAHLVAYSRHVADRHVIAHLGIDRERVHVIPHAPFDGLAALTGGERHGAGARTDGQPAFVREQALRALRDYVQRHARDQPACAVLASSALEAVRFVFVTTQVRATKNFLNLFGAFARLEARRDRGVKLIMTGSLDDRLADASVRSHVAAAGLEDDVLSLPGLPSDVHAACLALAQVTVVPTLFEGGFPFPFAESLSVGTPALMSAIPIVCEVIPAAIRSQVLFDPQDIREMADRIDWALDHRAELLALERPVYAELCRRDWTDVADDYRRVLRL